jgi:hypothetical protein
MNNVSIDFSILSDSGTFCKISGNINVPVIPQVGDKISFPFSEEYWKVFDNGDCLGYVSAPFTVDHRIIFAGGDEQSIIIMMKDVIVPSTQDAYRIAKYFELAHKLFSDSNE